MSTIPLTVPDVLTGLVMLAGLNNGADVACAEVKSGPLRESVGKS